MKQINDEKTHLVVISDQHIGGDKPIDDFKIDDVFVRFVSELYNESMLQKNKIELLIIGDFLDLWKISSENKIAQVVRNHKDVFSVLKKFGKQNTITLVPGNHDYELIYKKLQFIFFI